MSEPRTAAREHLLEYATGAVDAEELKAQVEAAWSEILRDPDERETAAGILRVPSENLDRVGTEPPVALDAGESGTGVVETAVIVFVTTVGYDLLKDLTKEAAKVALLTLWERVIKPKVEQKLPLGAFGAEKTVQDAETGTPTSRS